MTGRRASVAGSQTWLLASALIGMGATLAMTIVVARFAPLEVLGFFALVGAIFSLARDVTDLGTSSAACREAAGAPERESEVIGQLLAWRLIPSAILALGCLAFAITQDSVIERWILAGSAIVVFAGFNNGLFAVFQLRQSQSVPAAINIGANLFAVAGGVIIIASDADPMLFVGLIIIREASVIVCNRVAALRYLSGPPQVIRSFTRIRKWLLGPLSHYALAAIAWHLLLNSGVFIIYVLSSGAQLGAFGAAFRLATPLFSLSWLLTAPLVPVFALAWQRDRALFAAQVMHSLQLAIGIAALLATIGAVLSPALIELLLGSQLLYEGGAVAGDTLRWFMLAFAASIVVAVCAPALLAMREERRLAQIAWVSFAIALAAACVFAGASRISLVAAAIAIGMVVSAVAGLVLLQRAARLRLGFTLTPAVFAFVALLLIPQAAPAFVKVAGGCILAAAGLAALYFQPGMASFRKEQDRLANATSWGNPQTGGEHG